MKPTRSFVVPVISAALLALGACGGRAASPEVASAGGGHATPSAAVDVVAQYVEQQRAWVKCLREQGVEVSDPDPKGRVQFVGDNAQLKRDPKFRTAQEKCRGLISAMPKELEERPQLTAEQVRWLQDYAKCMRQYGSPHFPDPGPDGSWPERTPDSTGGELRADAICHPVAEGRTPDPSATPGAGLG